MGKEEVQEVELTIHLIINSSEISLHLITSLKLLLSEIKLITFNLTSWWTDKKKTNIKCQQSTNENFERKGNWRNLVETILGMGVAGKYVGIPGS